MSIICSEYQYIKLLQSIGKLEARLQSPGFFPSRKGFRVSASYTPSRLIQHSTTSSSKCPSCTGDAISCHTHQDKDQTRNSCFEKTLPLLSTFSFYFSCSISFSFSFFFFQYCFNFFLNQSSSVSRQQQKRY